MNLKKPLTWFAIGFGSGLSPLIPGTVGSLLASLIFYFLIAPFLRPFAYIFILCIYVFLVVTSFFFGLYLYKKTMSNEKDAKIFVWDEFVGMWVATFPLVAFESFWPWIIVSFILFRFFDIFKPYPISLVDKKMKSGLGIVLDDILAGLFTLIVILLFFWGVNF